jgi:2OG-Fe(II) oxygenase superfamily
VPPISSRRGNRFAWSVQQFAPEASSLRAQFDAHFSDPLKTHPKRFVWDLWHVENQYTALRTPAYAYFSRAVYQRFHRRLVQWGRQTLGCHDVSPPWMSCYVNGCEQKLHADVPHGPFAFVFSLTDWARRTFRGGETLLLKESVLDYAHAFDVHQRVEMDALFHSFAPHFNALTVFDPSIPHGVAQVSGSLDPRLGRLVIHGWFVQPRPYIVGTLKPQVLERCLDDIAASVFGGIDFPLNGLLSVRFVVKADGRVERPRVLADTTRTSMPHEARRRQLRQAVLRALQAWTFPQAKSASTVTVPLVFVQQR